MNNTSAQRVIHLHYGLARIYKNDHDKINIIFLVLRYASETDDNYYKLLWKILWIYSLIFSNKLLKSYQ